MYGKCYSTELVERDLIRGHYDLSKYNITTPFCILYSYQVAIVLVHPYSQWMICYLGFEFNVQDDLLCSEVQFQCTLPSTMYPLHSVYSPAYIHVTTVSNLSSTEVASSQQIRSNGFANSQKSHFYPYMAFPRNSVFFVLSDFSHCIYCNDIYTNGTYQCIQEVSGAKLIQACSFLTKCQIYIII